MIDSRASKWLKEDFEAILERMRKQKRSLADVCGDADLPTQWAWLFYVKKHPEFLEKERRIHYTLPYSVQLKIQDVSPRFRVECERMRADGMTMKQIEDTLNVS